MSQGYFPTGYWGDTSVAVVSNPPLTIAGPLHERLIQDLVTVIKQLNLAGASQSGDIAGNVYAKSLADDMTDVQLPGVLVCTEGGEEILEESFEFRDWGYPVAILLLDSASTLDPNIRPDFLSWRHLLMVDIDELPARASTGGDGGFPFLPSSPECWTMSLRPRSVFEQWDRTGTSPGAAQKWVLASTFVVLCHCNELRNRS